MGNGDVNVLEELIKVLDFANFIRKYLLNKIYWELIKCKLCLLEAQSNLEKLFKQKRVEVKWTAFPYCY